MSAVDTAENRADCYVEITVTDKNMFSPVFKLPTYSFSVPEDTNKGVTIGRVEVRLAKIITVTVRQC